MKANELRKGCLLNFLIKDENGGPIKGRIVTALTTAQISKLDELENPDDFWEPIPLSPEILQACGFENKGGWMGKKYIAQIYDEETEIVFEVMDNVLVIYANDVRVRKIDSPALHQVMNLWESFTGSELTVNLEKVKA